MVEIEISHKQVTNKSYATIVWLACPTTDIGG
jgi:hypothetical protein